MTQVIVIGLVLTLLAHDASGAPALVRFAPPWEIALASILPALALGLFVHAWVWRCGRRIDRTGSAVSIASADAACAMGRWGALGLHAVSVLLLGWLDVVRRAVGDWPLVDEAIATLPALLLISSTWLAYAGIDARLRQASLFGALERGEAIYPIRTTWQYVSDQVRGQLLFILVPMALVLGWVETLNIAVERWGDRLPIDLSTRGAALGLGAIQLAGSIVVFLIAPSLIRHVWSTARLGPGPLRDRLEELCARQGVTHRGLLVWRTHGAMLNGAVMGLVGRFRYILLTDALLDHLSDGEVEAVLAHELGHVRRRHIPWLMVVMTTSLAVAGGLVGVAEWALTKWGASVTPWIAGAPPDVIGAVGLVVAVALGMWGVGYVSRRFERQADAFAVQHLSGMTRDERAAAGRFATPEAAATMAGALRAVARRNFIPVKKRSWRHGSIADRIGRIERLVGAPLLAFPIDREVRFLKRATLVIAAALIVWAVLGS